MFWIFCQAILTPTYNQKYENGDDWILTNNITIEQLIATIGK